MRITVTGTDDDSSPIILGDDEAGLPISGRTIDQQRAAQVSPLFRAAKPLLAGRGNRVYEISFGVSREHASLAEAERFILDHPQAVPEDCLMEIEANGPGGYSVLKLDALITRVTLVAQFGVSTSWRYSIYGVDQDPSEL